MTVPSTFLIDFKTEDLAKMMSAAPTNCPLRSSTYSSDFRLRAFSFRVLATAISHSCRGAGCVDMICWGLNSTISWKPTATMSGECWALLVSGHSQAERSSLVPLSLPLRLNVPTQIFMTLEEEYSAALDIRSQTVSKS